MRTRTLAGIISLALASAACADPLPANPTVDQVLAALKTRGDTLQDFSANVSLKNIDQSTADSSTNRGTVLFQRLGQGDGRIRVNFTQLINGDKAYDQRHEYELANGLLVDRDYEKKHENRRQVTKPGEKINLLKLGEGPFPLPIGQDPDAVKREFDVSLVNPAPTDPPGTIHLRLDPKPESDFHRRFTELDVWVDRQSDMPVRIKTLNDANDNAQITDLADVKLNQHPTDADFTLPPVQGWDVSVEPYQ